MLPKTKANRSASLGCGRAVVGKENPLLPPGFRLIGRAVTGLDVR